MKGHGFFLSYYVSFLTYTSLLNKEDVWLGTKKAVHYK
jgi:hypothetical protein